MIEFVLQFVGRYIRSFWRNCPTEALLLLATHVIPGALNDPSATATDIILRGAPTWPWYQDQPYRIRQRFHQLAGHAVRAARGYEVVRTPGGRPLMRRSKDGPHRRFTVQMRVSI
jgi:hypothetical protein